MKALVKKEAKKGIWMEDVPMPKVGVNDVLIKIKKTAICGTDLHIYKWDEWSQKTIKTPMTIGHEYPIFQPTIPQRLFVLRSYLPCCSKVL